MNFKRNSIFGMAALGIGTAVCGMSISQANSNRNSKNYTMPRVTEFRSGQSNTQPTVSKKRVILNTIRKDHLSIKRANAHLHKATTYQSHIHAYKSLHLAEKHLTHDKSLLRKLNQIIHRKAYLHKIHNVSSNKITNCVREHAKYLLVHSRSERESHLVRETYHIFKQSLRHEIKVEHYYQSHHTKHNLKVLHHAEIKLASIEGRFNKVKSLDNYLNPNFSKGNNDNQTQITGSRSTADNFNQRSNVYNQNHADTKYYGKTNKINNTQTQSTIDKFKQQGNRNNVNNQNTFGTQSDKASRANNAQTQTTNSIANFKQQGNQNSINNQNHAGIQYSGKNTLPQTSEINNQTNRIFASIVLGITGIGLGAFTFEKNKNQKKLATINTTPNTSFNNGRNEIDYLLDSIKNGTNKLNNYVSKISNK